MCERGGWGGGWGGGTMCTRGHHVYQGAPCVHPAPIFGAIVNKGIMPGYCNQLPACYCHYHTCYWPTTTQSQ